MFVLHPNKQRKIVRKESRNFKQLKDTLIEASISNTFEDSIHEWTKTDHYFVINSGYNCTCGEPNIHELYIIENILTGIELTLGNCCIDHFCNTDSILFFRALAKISNDRARSANTALITFAQKEKVFDHCEFVFYINIRRRDNKSLSPEQLARKQYLNLKLLEYFNLAEIPRGLR